MAIRDYIALTKPRITWLILMSTAIGFYFGKLAAGPAADLAFVLLHLLVGTALLASGTAALNQWWERESDVFMTRTATRPLPSGKMPSANALVFGLLLSLAGLLQLGVGCNWLTSGLGLFTLVTYLLVYTPLKRRSPHSTTVGAIPGAMPPLLGFAAATGELSPAAWALYALLFVWQFPHFYAIAWMYRHEYARAGIRMLPVVAPKLDSTAHAILWTTIALIPTSLAPVALSMAGNAYLAVALLMGAVFLWAAVQLFRSREEKDARTVLLASVVYLPVLYAALVFAPN
jgi:protoheme IX farnesyltransferase